MDITTLAAWGEFLGGIAVVISLIYLASQIRQNSKLLRASTATVTQQSTFGPNAMIVADPELSRIWWEGMADRSALSEAEQQRFDPLLGMQTNGLQQHFRLSRDGIISSEIWNDMVQGHRWNVRNPGWLQWWHQYEGDIYIGDFRDFVDDLIREGEEARSATE
jgi:hypothetical protein